MVRFTILVMVGVALFVTPMDARAGCEKDTDCKGDRICVEGECVSPGRAGVNRIPATPPADAGGWALGASITGFISAGVTMGLGTGSAILRGKGEKGPAVGMGVAATVLMGALGPTVNAGSSSARDGTTVGGSLGLRVTGWVLYGITLASSVSFMVMGLGFEKPPHPAQLGVTGGLGGLSLTFFSIDALISRSQAIDYWRKGATADADRPSPGLQLAPLITPVVSPADGVTGTSIGIAGRF